MTHLNQLNSASKKREKHSLKTFKRRQVQINEIYWTLSTLWTLESKSSKFALIAYEYN